ncbi:FG-GAP-like repeat-containing protein [Streptomyces xylophagus]|uniref:FG-GAP-like repeat-containing protein n=1 Tax=Streptomyces xylophagus TaxID=285514 RepID=UPI0005BAAD06|nr:FG-GAP-like repeat-containing protein [Streptomyces xylophagus]
MSGRVRSALAALVTVGVLAALSSCGAGSPGKAKPSGAAGHMASVGADFNGDGYADLAVGAPYATVDGRNEAGYVAVMYGSAHGLSTAHRTIINRATPGTYGGPKIVSMFGAELAKGDLDGDGYADLVVGTMPNTGMVVAWGGRQGLSSPTELPHPGTLSAVGDFNGDGHLDLVLFATAHSLDDGPSGTTETVWYGPISRAAKPSVTSTLTTPSDSVYQVDKAVSGDVNGDGRADLAVVAGTSSGTTGFRTDLYLGSAAGLRRAPDRHVPQGNDVALGDVNGDGCADVVTAGAKKQQVVIGYGSKDGVAPASRWTTITRDTPGIPGRATDDFASDVAVGDVTGDGVDDIAVGATRKRVGKVANSGAVLLLRGRHGGVTGSDAQEFTQDTPGVPGSAARHDYFGDYFGETVQLLDVNGNGHADLAVSASKNLAGDPSPRNSGEGTVWLLRGRPTGLTSDAALAFGPRTIGAPSSGAHFGLSLG